MLVFYLIIVYGLAYIADLIYFSRYATGSITLKYCRGTVFIYRSGLFRDHLLYTLSKSKYESYQILQICNILEDYPIVPKGTTIKRIK